MYISKLLLNWYNSNRRDLPWRDAEDPYKIWVSEIILQQTRIKQGLAYYQRFIKRYPDIHSLARAKIEDVLNLWQGLGYYSRARNMHYTARTIVNEMNGKFPAEFNEIKKLKGIGEYTAGAIASIAFNKPVPAIDGNVKRVASRLFMIYEDTDKPEGLKKIRKFLLDQMAGQNPGAFNQSLMDLGATICKPVNPLCDICPLEKVCEANLKNMVNEFPVKYKKIKIRNRYFYYLVINYQSEILIHQRKNKDIWKLLYEFPLIETDHRLDEKEIFNKIVDKFFSAKQNIQVSGISDEIVHILSHQKIHTHFIHINADKLPGNIYSEYLKIKKENIDNYPLPRLIERYLPNILK